MHNALRGLAARSRHRYQRAAGSPCVGAHIPAPGAPFRRQSGRARGCTARTLRRSPWRWWQSIGGGRIQARPCHRLRYGARPLRSRLACEFFRTRCVSGPGRSADVPSRFTFIALNNRCQLDFVLPDQPQIRPGHIALGTVSEVPVVKGNPSSEKFHTFHPDTMRRMEIVALIWIKSSASGAAPISRRARRFCGGDS